MEEADEQAKAVEYFKERAAKGKVLTPQEMASWARQKGMKLTADDLKDIRYRVLGTAYASKYQKPPHLAGMTFPRIGYVHIDLANFYPEYRKENDGCGAYLMAVDSLSLAMAAVPTKDATYASWLSAMEEMIQGRLNVIHFFVSDRDASIRSV